MPIKRQEDVVQFEVPIDDSFGVEVLQGEQDFAGVELGLSKGELFLLYMEHEVAAGNILHNEINAGLGLET